MKGLKKFVTISALVGALAGCEKQEAPVPHTERDPEAKVWLTRYQRIEKSHDRDGNEVWYSEPHARDGYNGIVGRTTTIYFNDGRIRLYDWNIDQTWDYGPDGTTMTDRFGNKYRVEKQNK